MTICSTSLSTRCIPICTQELLIGSITEVDTDVHVYIKNLTTGKIDLHAATSDESGNVTIDLSEYTYSDNHTFELYATAAGSSEKLDITIGESTNTLVSLCFEDIAVSTGAYVASNEQLIEA